MADYTRRLAALERSSAEAECACSGLRIVLVDRIHGTPAEVNRDLERARPVHCALHGWTSPTLVARIDLSNERDQSPWTESLTEEFL